jgi:1,4-dihydroxy-2-naphthoate octaprenyltransferase
MKDTVITARMKKRELMILLCCFATANLINIVAILCYGTRWIELFSQIGYVLFVTAVLYVLQLAARWVLCGLLRGKRG